MIKLSHIISEMKQNYTVNTTLHGFYVSPDVMENPTYNPNPVSTTVKTPI